MYDSKVRMLPQLLGDRTNMFRYQSCKFNAPYSKRKTARLALWKEFGYQNCYTLESSFFGFLNSKRETEMFSSIKLAEMGVCMGETF